MFWSTFGTLLQLTQLSTRWRRLVHQLELLTCGTGESFNESAYGPDYFQCARYGLGAVAMVTSTFNCKLGAFSYPFLFFSTGEPEQV